MHHNMSKIITTEQIEIIKKLLLKRNTHKEIKDILDNLSEDKLIKENGENISNS